jgi:hypothetical protein
MTTLAADAGVGAEALARVQAALEHLTATGAELSIASVARAAKVSRAFVYRHDDLRAVIADRINGPGRGRRRPEHGHQPRLAAGRGRQPAGTQPPAGPPHHQAGGQAVGAARRAGLPLKRARRPGQHRADPPAHHHPGAGQRAAARGSHQPQGGPVGRAGRQPGAAGRDQSRRLTTGLSRPHPA